MEVESPKFRDQGMPSYGWTGKDSGFGFVGRDRIRLGVLPTRGPLDAARDVGRTILGLFAHAVVAILLSPGEG